MNPSYVDDVHELCDYTLKWPTGQTVNNTLCSNHGGQWVAQENHVVGGVGGRTGGHCKIPFELQGN